MKKINVLFMLLAILLIMSVSLSSFSQEKKGPDSSSAIVKESSYILAGAAFNSDIIFLGRKGLSKSPYISAYAGYYHQSGFFITGIVSYLAASQQNRIDLFTASGGYDFYKKNFTTGVSATGYAFNNKSYTVKSALTANLNAYAGYDFGILEVYTDGTIYFSNQSDFIFSAAVSHNFYTANDKLKISPTFSLYGGTQNYYSNYNNNKRFGQHMLNTGNSNTMGTGMMNGSILNIQDYEFSIPVIYDLKHFRFQFLPAYAIPVNPATITDNQSTYQEDLSNTYFWSIGVFYKFSKQKTK